MRTSKPLPCSKKLPHGRAACLAAALLLVEPAMAGNTLGDRLDIHAFINQSAVYTSNNNFYGKSDNSTSFDSNEVGAVLTGKITENLAASLQVLSRNAGEGDTGDPRVDYAFLNYRFFNSVDKNYSIRAGKLRLPYGLYNDTRDIASTNPSILLPQSIYIDAGRNTFFAANGVILQGEHFGESNALRWEAGAVKNDTNGDEISDLSGLNAQKSDGGGNNFIGRMLYTQDYEKYKIALSYREHELLFTPSFTAYPIGIPAPAFTVNLGESSVSTKAWLLSGQYTLDKFSLTSEYSHADVSLDVTGFSQKFSSSAYYLQGQYFITPAFSLLARADYFYKDRNDKNGEGFVGRINAPIPIGGGAFATTSLARNTHSQYAEDMTLGASWTPTKNLQLRAEWHNIEGTGWLSGADNTAATETAKHWDIFILQAAYRF